MIHPTYQVTEEIYIHAARAAIWARFCRVTEWPRWRADIATATWVSGGGWQEGARFSVSTTGADTTPPETFTIRMVVPADTTVWEKSSSQGMVYSLLLADQVGGCKVTLRCTFHGWGSLLKRLATAREKAHLHMLLAALKTTIEGDRARG